MLAMADMQHEQNSAQPSSSDATVVPPTPQQSQPRSQSFEDAGFTGVEQNELRRDSPAHNNGTTTQAPPLSSIERTFTQALEQYQRQLDQNFQEFESQLEQRPRDEDLEQLDWEELEHEYEEEAGRMVAEEHDIMREFDARFKVSLALLGSRLY